MPRKPDLAPQGVAIVGKSLLAKFKYQRTVTLHTISVLAGSSQNQDKARFIGRYMADNGYCEIHKQEFGPAQYLTLAERWNSWEEAYKQWCADWGLEVPS